MLGLASSSLGGLIASISYLIIYVLMTIAFFILILNTEHIVTKKNIVYLSELYCFSIYSPKFARYLAIVLLSMAGIPPLGGFIGKLFIYVVAIDAGLDSAVFLSLLISIISTYYYLNFIHYTWFVKFNKIRLYYFNLNFVLNLFLIGILLLLIGFILIFPYVFSIATTLAFSCIWPFFFF